MKQFAKKLLMVVLVVSMCVLPSFATLAQTTDDDNLVYFKGDVNFDEAIDKFDYILVKRYCLDTITFNDEQKTRGDVNYDEAIDKFDYILIKRHCFNTYEIPKFDASGETNIKNDPRYTNVALKKTYTKSPANSSYPDEGNKTMTDGKIATGTYSDAAFMGVNSTNTDFYRFNGYTYIRVDLGAVYELDKFVAQVATDKFAGAGIYTPEMVQIRVSNDGNEWYKAGTVVNKKESSANVLASTLELEETVTARYVEYRLLVGTPGWVFVCEVEAYGVKATKAKAYPKEDIIDMLFIGNSSTYYFSIPDKLTLIAESVGKKIDATYCTIGSAWLKDFANETTTHGKLLRSKLAEKQYDIIVIQENSNADYADLKSAMNNLVPLLKNSQPNAELVLYERYSSSTSTTQRPISGKKHHEAYSQVAKDFNIEKNAHVADAFLLCYEKYPAIQLHHTDNSHHSHAGGYLSASVMAIEFLGIDLDKVTYTANLNATTVNALKEIAKLACTEGYPFK